MTVEGRTSLNETVCTSSRPSPFGDRTARSAAGMDAVEDHQRVGHGALGPVRRTVEQLAVEGHRRRAAGIQGRALRDAEPDECLRELEVGHAGRVAGLATVDRHEDERAVWPLADAGARMAKRKLVAGEVFERRNTGTRP